MPKHTTSLPSTEYQLIVPLVCARCKHCFWHVSQNVYIENWLNQAGPQRRADGVENSQYCWDVLTSHELVSIPIQIWPEVVSKGSHRPLFMKSLFIFCPLIWQDFILFRKRYKMWLPPPHPPPFWNCNATPLIWFWKWCIPALNIGGLSLQSPNTSSE